VNPINDGASYCCAVWNPVAGSNQGRVGYRRRDVSAKRRLPYVDKCLTKIPLIYYKKFKSFEKRIQDPYSVFRVVVDESNNTDTKIVYLHWNEL
jgi:hypothetical protein